MTDLVLVIGSGAREHALAWKLSQSPLIKHVYVSPGNAGTHTTSKFSNCDVDVTDHAEVVLWCRTKNIKLVVVGPEDPLAKGLADHLKEADIDCFGPCQKAAQIEASKEFAKFFMDRYEIPTARWKSFTSAKEAQDHILSAPYDALVVKASGLAAGKGVIVGENKEDAIKAVETLKQDKGLSAASDIIVIEELLKGEEVSVLCFSDGTNIAVMPPAQDHKRLLDGDEGPNTGGMGAYCRCPLVSDADLKFIQEKILQRAIDGMKKEDFPYVGVLYAGLMLTKDGPKVLEFNCRFGDPETQVILPLLETDLYSVMTACVKGELHKIPVSWNEKQHAVGVVLASGGYPGSYVKGKLIKGYEKLTEDCFVVFHAGTSSKSGSILTSGGRVLTVVAVCDSLKEAAAKAIQGAETIHFEGAFFRRDIAKKGLQKLQSKGMTYKASGVDIEAGDDLVDKIKKLTKKTLRKEVCGGIGGFGGIFELSGYVDPLLISKVGCVGEKLMIAQECQKYEVIGNDLVANSVNEILCYGAEPLFFLDTFTCGKLKVEIAADVITGIAKGCMEAHCTLIGGETAEMPGMYFQTDFDLTSFARGAVERSRLLPREKDFDEEDIVIGLLSSNLNSNGIKIVRRLLTKLNLSYTDATPYDSSCSFQDALLSPQNIYVDAIFPLIRKNYIKSATYINKGGLAEHLEKLVPKGYEIIIDGSSWTLPPIFRWISEHTGLTKQDLLKDLSGGIDMILIVDKHDAGEVLAHIELSGKMAAPIGLIRSHDKGSECVQTVNIFDDCQTPLQKKKVGVLTSDKGTTLKSLIKYSQTPRNLSSFEIAVVLSADNGNNLEIARAAQIPTKVLDADTSVTEVLKSHKVDIVCLDNFSRELPKDLRNEWEGKVLNIHPSLLPSFKCENAHEEALELGVKITGCTAYLLGADESNETILDQSAIAVETNDTIETLREKVSCLKNSLYPKAVELFASRDNLKTSDLHLLHAGYSSLNSEEELKLNKCLQALVRSTKRPGFTESAEPSCGVFDLKASGYQHPYLISGTDGVGTKLKIAQVCNKHDTIGIDLVAMCVNDILTHGAEPLFFLEAFDCGQINTKTVTEVVSGIAEGCKQANCALIGTEINEMPDIYLNPKESLCDFEKYDVVGYAEGALEKKCLLPRVSEIKPGDVVIGLSSSGVHSNGYSLVRKLVKAKNYTYQDPFPLDKTKTLQDVLLEPTKIYVRSVLPLIRKGYVKAAAHITGGGLTLNIPRVLPSHLKVVLDGSKWKMPLVLQWIAAEGQLSEEEMLQTFNCGLGMVLIADQTYEKQILEALKETGETASNVGSVTNLEKGKKNNVQVLSHKEYKKRVDFDMAVHAILKECGVEIICLAGFMRILSKEFCQLWQGKLLNVHPAILPSFKGVNAHKQALEAGAKITGCSVHFVEPEVDAGAIIEQASVRVESEDDEKSLQEKNTLPKPRPCNESERPATTTANRALWPPLPEAHTMTPLFLQGYDPSLKMDPQRHNTITISHREVRLCVLIQQVLIPIFAVPP
ncbi:Trifunctional purine biosynthetic protein adenosine-3 [Araneus ventricosus]|uniref:Trifunctional purine biosynthetic protein adenosine-3 n=1 Tax=Araneus ventricosus TaxID=182803 RepID=A0A4Y2GLM3_ARAVE|nr:Trifunctional purine biosynthetic protein adenosine-3 [Araneus ventricosus]